MAQGLIWRTLDDELAQLRDQRQVISRQDSTLDRHIQYQFILVKMYSNDHRIGLPCWW